MKHEFHLLRLVVDWLYNKL